MTTQEFKDFCAIEVIKTFLQKFPGVGLPNDPQNYNARSELIRRLSQDAWEMAVGMSNQRELHNPQPHI